MAKTKPVAQEEVVEVVEDVKQAIKKPAVGLIKVRVIHPVLGYSVGDEFETSRHAVRFQLKHKSLIEVE